MNYWKDTVVGALRYRRLIAAVLIIALAFSLSRPTAAEDVAYLPLQNLLAELQDALVRIQDAADAQNIPPLEKVSLSVETVVATKSGGGVDLYVFSAGGDVSEEQTNEIEINLVPPKAGTASNVSGTGVVSDALVASVIAAGRVITNAKKGSPPLVADSVTITLRFRLEKEIEGGVKFEILPLSIHAGVSGSSQHGHSLVVVYSKPE